MKKENSDSIEQKLLEEDTTETFRKIYNFIKSKKEGVTSVEIIKELKISRPIVEKQLAKLIYENLVDVKKYGGTFVYFPNGVFIPHPKHGNKTIAYRCGDTGRFIWINLFKRQDGKDYIYLVETVKTSQGYDKRGAILVPLSEAESFAQTLEKFAEGAKVSK